MEEHTTEVRQSKANWLFYRFINRLFGLGELNKLRVEKPKSIMEHMDEAFGPEVNRLPDNVVPLKPARRCHRPAVIHVDDPLTNAGACVSQAYFDEIQK